MALKLMYITNDAKYASIAERSDVDWVFIDLEINGKQDRQGHLDTVISRHHIDDVKKVKKALTKSELLVRVNPIYEGSKEEIGRVVDDGADLVMLPFFKTKQEVSRFVELVGGRTKTVLLLETPEAAENIDEILSVRGIDYIHIGLNDLHLGYGMKFMFEPLADGKVDRLCRKIDERKIPYGFGGIAQLGKGELPAENVIAEHYRLGSSMAILSRSFCNLKTIDDTVCVESLFRQGVGRIREYEESLKEETEVFFRKNKKVTREIIQQIRNSKVEANEKSTSHRGIKAQQKAVYST